MGKGRVWSGDCDQTSRLTYSTLEGTKRPSAKLSLTQPQPLSASGCVCRATFRANLAAGSPVGKRLESEWAVSLGAEELGIQGLNCLSLRVSEGKWCPAPGLTSLPLKSYQVSLSC